MQLTLSLTAEQQSLLQDHLFPGDGLEAAAILVCGRRNGQARHRLMVREVHPVPYDACSIRRTDLLTWDTDVLVPLLEGRPDETSTIVKVHSHPSGVAHFSHIDVQNDRRLMSAISGWHDDPRYHASVIMLPSGEMFGHYLSPTGDFVPLSAIHVTGEELISWPGVQKESRAAFAASHRQAFGEATFDKLANLSVAVAGCSGTGSPVVEQLARLGVGRLVLVDDDVVELRNINRILNSTAKDAEAKRNKVDVLAEAVNSFGTGMSVLPLAKNLWDVDAVKEIAECDVIFGCLDSVDGRFILNLISTFYTIPYFDTGVRILADTAGGSGGVSEVCGSVHYIQPGGSSLISRGLFTMDHVAAAGLARTDPKAHEAQLKEGYIVGADVRRPAVVSLNMHFASLAVMELLARLHPFREEPNHRYHQIEFSFGSMEVFPETHPEPCSLLAADLGKGDTSPLLGLPQLGGAF